MLKPVGQPRLPRITKATAHITIMLAHIQRNPQSCHLTRHETK
jgi:hypothetical protein